jgi:hypothetical protein
MPYSSVSDLPEGHRTNVETLSPKRRRQFLAVWNDVYRRTGDEGKAYAAAYSATGLKGHSSKEGAFFQAAMEFGKVRRGEAGEKFISMIASTTAIDSQNERVTSEFIGKMKQAAAQGKVDLLATHQDPFPMGCSVGVVDVEGRQDVVFAPEFRLDGRHPLSDILFDAIESGKGSKYQNSIGGYARGRVAWDKERQEYIRELFDGELDHVAVTRAGRAANPETCFLTAAIKSIDWGDMEKEMSLSRTLSLVEAAVLREFGPFGGAYVRECFSDNFILCDEEGRYFSVEYTLSERGEVTFGERTEVTQVYVPIVDKEMGFGENDLSKASDDDTAAQKARSKKYGIGVKEGGHTTKPGEWEHCADGDFGDPVNYRYPMPDEKQAVAAYRYWSKPKNRSQYSSEEQSKIWDRIISHLPERMREDARQTASGKENPMDEKDKNKQPEAGTPEGGKAPEATVPAAGGEEVTKALSEIRELLSTMVGLLTPKPPEPAPAMETAKSDEPAPNPEMEALKKSNEELQAKIEVLEKKATPDAGAPAKTGEGAITEKDIGHGEDAGKKDELQAAYKQAVADGDQDKARHLFWAGAGLNQIPLMPADRRVEGGT